MIAASGANWDVVPQEWRQLWAAIDRDNVRLCLDTSHATTCAVATSDLAAQARAGAGVPRRWRGPDYARPLVGQLPRWASRPERLAPARGAGNVGQGTLPRPFHAQVKRLAAVKHLEHNSTAEELRDELAFIEQL